MRVVLVPIILTAFLINSLCSNIVWGSELLLPSPGSMVMLSSSFRPALLKGIKIHPEDPLRFDFILDQGQGKDGDTVLKAESEKLVRYFLASFTVPEKDLWVNLSPYEKDRIVPDSFGQTEMGRDLLAQDYLLKQITASLVYPEGDIGKQFWKKVYELAREKNVPVNTFNKVWIVPDKAVVYENAKNGTAYVVESSLKVLTEQDYLAQDKNAAGGAQAVRFARSLRGTMALSPATPRGDGLSEDERNSWATGPAHAIRDLVIPQLTKEVNTGANFAQLRQVYNSLILAMWYKKKIKDSILTKVYADKNKVDGITINDPKEKERIYAQYLEAFKKGAYNYIKEERDPLSGQVLPRKYFSGGAKLAVDVSTSTDAAMISDVKGLRTIMIVLKSSLSKDPAMTAKDITASDVIKTIKEFKVYLMRMADGREYIAKIGLKKKINKELFGYKIAAWLGVNTVDIQLLDPASVEAVYSRLISPVGKRGSLGFGAFVLQPFEAFRAKQVRSGQGSGLEEAVVFNHLLLHDDLTMSGDKNFWTLEGQGGRKYVLYDFEEILNPGAFLPQDIKIVEQWLGVMHQIDIDRLSAVVRKVEDNIDQFVRFAESNADGLDADEIRNVKLLARSLRGRMVTAIKAVLSKQHGHRVHSSQLSRIVTQLESTRRREQDVKVDEAMAAQLNNQVGKASFRPEGMILPFFLANPRVFSRGWWFAFDVDRAGEIRDVNKREVLIRELNRMLIKRLSAKGARFFGTWRNKIIQEKEEGLVYVPVSVGSKELLAILDEIRNTFKAASDGQTVSFAVVNAADFGRQVQPKISYWNLTSIKAGIASLQRGLEVLLDKEAKGPKTKIRTVDYGDKTVVFNWFDHGNVFLKKSTMLSDLMRDAVFTVNESRDMAQVSPTGGIDLTRDRLGVESNVYDGSIRFQIDPVKLKELQESQGFSPVIINMLPLSDLRSFLGIKALAAK